MPAPAVDFGNPLASTDLVLCAFERNAGTPSLLLRATAPAAGLCRGRPCWKAHGTSFTYHDPELRPDGLLLLSLRPALTGARVKAKAKRALLSLPRPPLVPSLTVRLRRSDAPACWEADFSRSQRNDTVMFKAKSG